MGAIQSVQSLWDQEPCYWDQLPNELQEKIYREAVNNMSPRELAAERYANAPGGWKHWLRTSPIGPELERQVRIRASGYGISEKSTSLMLRDMVKGITRLAAYQRDAFSVPLRVLSDSSSNRNGLIRVRMKVQFSMNFGAVSEWSPWIHGRWFYNAELHY
jgi:hypothetical protein